jgi:NTP pyrophosphatase (non-canonical NTP hydrolase)
MMISEQLRKELLAFRSEREWAQFHNLRTLSTSIVLEAAELAEITQWARDADIGRIEHDQLGRIEHEVADIAILLTYLAHDCGIDIETAVRRKLRINAEKYPVERSRGTSKKYTEF